MADTNPKPKQPSLLRQLFEGGAFLPSAGGAYTTLKKVGKQISSNIASNIEPLGYTDELSQSKSKLDQKAENAFLSAKKFFNAGVLNKTSMARLLTEHYVKSDSGDNEMKNRLDLVNMWAGKPQRFNTVQKSEYKPTVGAEPNMQYYKIPGVEKQLFSDLVRNGVMQGRFNGPIKSKQDLENALKIQEGGFFSEAKDDSGKKIGYTGTIMSLGEGTVSIGEDAKGPYISYYDKWDINPLYGVSSAMGAVLPKSVQRGIDKVVTGIPEKMGITSAPRVYGRIYFDKQTGKPIGKDFEDIFSKLQSEAKQVEQPVEEGKQSPGSTGGFAGLLKKKSSGPVGKKK